MKQILFKISIILLFLYIDSGATSDIPDYLQHNFKLLGAFNNDPLCKYGTKDSVVIPNKNYIFHGSIESFKRYILHTDVPESLEIIPSSFLSNPKEILFDQNWINLLKTNLLLKKLGIHSVDPYISLTFLNNFSNLVSFEIVSTGSIVNHQYIHDLNGLGNLKNLIELKLFNINSATKNLQELGFFSNLHILKFGCPLSEVSYILKHFGSLRALERLRINEKSAPSPLPKDTNEQGLIILQNILKTTPYRSYLEFCTQTGATVENFLPNIPSSINELILMTHYEFLENIINRNYLTELKLFASRTGFFKFNEYKNDWEKIDRNEYKKFSEILD